MPANETISIYISIQGEVAKELSQVVRQMRGFSQQADRQAKRAARAFKPLRASLRGTAGMVQRLTGRWTAMLTTIAGTAVIFKSISDAQKFGLAIAEIGTIFSGTEEELKMVEERILEFSEALGFAETVAAKGFYQIISADITDAAEAMVVLEESAKLATVGLADIKQTIDVVTSVIKAYGVEVDEADRITDVLFQTVIKGKTTIPELATSLGQVLPIAATLGVSLEEVTAAIATITQGGIETNTAVIQLRQAFNQILKPSSEAAALLAQYGIDLSVARIRTEGFASVITELRDKLGDNAAAYSQIFGNIRALIPILALTGNQYDQFNRVLDANRDAFNRVEDSLENLLQNPFKRFQVFFNALRIRLRAVGEAFITEISDAIDARGGVDVVVNKIAVGFEALKGVAVGAAQSIGDVIDQIDSFVISFGGIERAEDILRRFGNLVGQLGRRIVSSLVTGLQALVQILLRLPEIIRAVSFQFKTAVNEIASFTEFGDDPLDFPFPEVKFAQKFGGEELDVQLREITSQRQRVLDEIVNQQNLQAQIGDALILRGIDPFEGEGLSAIQLTTDFRTDELQKSFLSSADSLRRLNQELATLDKLRTAISAGRGLQDIVSPEEVFGPEFLEGLGSLSKSFEGLNDDFAQSWDEFVNGVTLSYSERLAIGFQLIGKRGRQELVFQLSQLFGGLTAEINAEQQATELANKYASEFAAGLEIAAALGAETDEAILSLFQFDPQRAVNLVKDQIQELSGIFVGAGVEFSDKTVSQEFLNKIVQGGELFRDLGEEIEATTDAQREFLNTSRAARLELFRSSEEVAGRTPEFVEQVIALWERAEDARLRALGQEDLQAQEPFLTRTEALNRNIEESLRTQLAAHAGIKALLADKEKDWTKIAELVASVRGDVLSEEGGFVAGFSAGLKDTLEQFRDLTARGGQFAEQLVSVVRDPVRAGIQAALTGDENTDAMEVFAETLRQTLANTLSDQLSQSITELIITPLQDVLTNTLGSIGGFLFGAGQDAAAALSDIAGDTPEIAAEEALTAATTSAATQMGSLTGQAATAGLSVDSLGVQAAFASPVLEGLSFAAIKSTAPIQTLGGSASFAASPINALASAAAAASASLQAFAAQRAVGLANGGIMGGPGTAIQEFATGGIPQRVENITSGGRVIRDTLFRVGEGKMKEAVVPLPGAGREIPVQLLEPRGGSQPTQQITVAPQIVINVTDTDPSTFQEKLMQQSPQIQSMLAETISQGVNRGLNQSIRKVARG